MLGLGSLGADLPLSLGAHVDQTTRLKAHLRSLLAQEPTAMPVVALQILGQRFHDGEALPLLERIARSSNPTVRVAALSAIGSLREGGGIPILLAALRDRSKRIRVTAAKALGDLLLEADSPPPVPWEEVDRALLDRALTDRSALVREAAVAALACSPGEQVGPGLLPALGDRVAAVRTAAVGSLLSYFREIPPESLLPFLGHWHPGVAACAARVLERLQGADALIPTLLTWLGGKRRLRLGAALALGALRAYPWPELLAEWSGTT